MFKFLRESVKEFDHVVWPTRAETLWYSQFVLGTIVGLCLILFVASSIMTTVLFKLHPILAPASTGTTTNTSQKSSSPALDLSQINLGTGVANSGVTVTPIVSSSQNGTTPVGSSGTGAAKK